jgi:hypothetical protein
MEVEFVGCVSLLPQFSGLQKLTAKTSRSASLHHYRPTSRMGLNRPSRRVRSTYRIRSNPVGW